MLGYQQYRYKDPLDLRRELDRGRATPISGERRTTMFKNNINFVTMHIRAKKAPQGDRLRRDL